MQLLHCCIACVWLDESVTYGLTQFGADHEEENDGISISHADVSTCLTHANCMDEDRCYMLELHCILCSYTFCPNRETYPVLEPVDLFANRLCGSGTGYPVLEPENI